MAQPPTKPKTPFSEPPEDFRVSCGIKPNYSTLGSPLSELINRMSSVAANYKCRELEMNVVDCTDELGRKALLQECRVVYEDYLECLFSKKQKLRVEAMNQERLRQYATGQRSKENLYIEAPKMDSYYRTYRRMLE